MSRRILVAFLFVVSGGLLSAQNHPYRVVFDLTSKDSLDQRAVMRWIHEITSAHPDAELEVVMYGKGYELVMPEKSYFLGDVRQAVKNPKVKFSVCQVALKNNNVDKGAILTEAGTVPDGIYEIISKQAEGWGYIKVGH